MLSREALSRYSRQIQLPELGIAGQERLASARVLVVGAGGLGSPAALYLAAAGVGTIGLVDDDAVDLGNLHRQILHGTRDVGRRKIDSATEALGRLNPQISVTGHHQRLTSDNADSLLEQYDLVVDGSDNYATRYAINDAATRMGVPWVYGSVERFSGQVSLFGAPDGPCYRCIFPEAPAAGSTANCEEIGVLGAVPGVIGSLQAVEAVKWIAGIGEPLVGRLLQLDLANGTTRLIAFDRRATCACSAGSSVRTVPDSATRGATDEQPDADIEPHELSQRLANRNGVQLLDIREEWEWSIGRIEGATLLPMSRLSSELASVSRKTEVILYCHHGSRSSVAADWLRSQGIRARSLSGGIDRWSREVDPSIARY